MIKCNSNLCIDSSKQPISCILFGNPSLQDSILKNFLSCVYVETLHQINKLKFLLDVPKYLSSSFIGDKPTGQKELKLS